MPHEDHPANSAPLAPPSKGIAATVATVVAIAGVIEAQYPGAIPIAGDIIHAKPVLDQILPTIMVVGGAIYAAASSAPRWLRYAFPWKKRRRSV